MRSKADRSQLSLLHGAKNSPHRIDAASGPLLQISHFPWCLSMLCKRVRRAEMGEPIEVPFGGRLKWPIRWRCTLMSSDKHDWTISVRRRCRFVSNYFDHLWIYRSQSNGTGSETDKWGTKRYTVGVCVLLSSVQSVDLKAFKMADFNESCDSQVDTATNHDQANTHDDLCFSEQFWTEFDYNPSGSLGRQ